MAANETDKRIVLLTGPPGAGKGTQAKILSRHYGWHSFSIGGILRQTADPRIRAIMDAGELLPAEHVVEIVKGELSHSDKGAVVDGFPRSLDQAEAFDRMIETDNLPRPEVIFIDIDKKTSWQRIKDRGRVDDEPTRWEYRWQEYRQKTIPAIDYCRRRGFLAEIDGSGTIEEVAALIEDVLNVS